MKRHLLAASVILASLTLAAQPQPYVEGELLVKFAAGPRGAAAEQARKQMQHEVKRHFDFIGWQQIRLPRGMTVQEGLARYRRLPGVIAAEPNALGHGAELHSASSIITPNDPRFAEQYGLTKIGATNAWAFSTGSTNVVVVVVDSGITYDHEDLRANMWRNPGEIPGNGLDDDGNGFVDDVYGIDVADDAFGNDSDPKDQGIPFYHGTACSGVIGAVANNQRGIVGVNWNVQLMAVRGITTANTISVADAIQAMNYISLMKDRGVNIKVINMSYGGTGFGGAAHKAAMDAVAARDILLAAVTHNQAMDIDVTPMYPANFDIATMIAVASSDQSDNLSTFSNWGRTNADLAAPGTGILMTLGPATNAYGFGNGTSFACPHVVGAAALIFAVNPDATPLNVKIAMMESVDQLPAFTNKMLSHGRLNLARAILHPAVVPNSPPFIAVSPQSQMVNEGGTASLYVRVFGAAPLGYRWFKDEQPVPDGTNDTLSFTSLTTAHSGAYQAIVSNVFGVRTSAVATLTVRTLPRLVAPVPPLQVSAVVGETLTFNVEASGWLPIGYRWRLIRTNGSSVNLTNFYLNQNRSFFTFTVATNSAGAYTIVLTNAAQPTTTIQRTNTILTVRTDSDSDGLPDDWEALYPAAGTSDEDTDLDGLTNLQEYRVGTDPTDPLSYLKVDSISLADGIRLTFFAISNKTYAVESRDALSLGTWNRMADVLAAPINRVVEVLDTNAPAATQRFYRLATPRTP